MEDGVNGTRGIHTIDHVGRPSLSANESVTAQYQNIGVDHVHLQKLFKQYGLIWPSVSVSFSEHVFNHSFIHSFIHLFLIDLFIYAFIHKTILNLFVPRLLSFFYREDWMRETLNLLIISEN